MAYFSATYYNTRTDAVPDDVSMHLAQTCYLSAPFVYRVIPRTGARDATQASRRQRLTGARPMYLLGVPS